MLKMFPWLRFNIFDEKDIKAILGKSLKLLGSDAADEIKEFVQSKQHISGGFVDRAGKPDLYYTLFGFFLADAFQLHNSLEKAGKYVENEITKSFPCGIYLQCAAILTTELSNNREIINNIRKKIRRDLRDRLKCPNEYDAFINLLACSYTRDLRSLLLVYKLSKRLREPDELPSTVLAAYLVLLSTFHKPVKYIRESLISFYDNNGGFRAFRNATVPDMLSTAVVLYALNYSGYDMRMIKPECMIFIDSHFNKGGFFSNILDHETDIEYTFYGLLALGSLAD